MLAASFRAVESHQAGDQAGECLGSRSIDGQARAVRVQPARILPSQVIPVGQHGVRVVLDSGREHRVVRVLPKLVNVDVHEYHT